MSNDILGFYRDFNLTKPGSKSSRKISAPDDNLKAYQRTKLPELEGIYHSLISGSEIKNVAHGFITGRNCVSAAIQHIGYELTIMMDISKFFDSVTRDMIANVSIEASQDKNYFHEGNYTPQGFVTSPILCNIASLPFIETIHNFLKALYGIGNFAFTIYADDIQISINRTRDERFREENSIINKIHDIAKIYGLNINKNKTRVRYAKYGYRRILGINVGAKSIQATRKTLKKIRAADHQGNYHSKGGLSSWACCFLPRSMRKKNK